MDFQSYCTFMCRGEFVLPGLAKPSETQQIPHHDNQKNHVNNVVIHTC